MVKKETDPEEKLISVFNIYIINNLARYPPEHEYYNIFQRTCRQ